MKKKNNIRIEDKDYVDGYGVDKRKTATVDKRKDRRFERALKTKNVDVLLEDDYADDLLQDEVDGYMDLYHGEDDNDGA